MARNEALSATDKLALVPTCPPPHTHLPPPEIAFHTPDCLADVAVQATPATQFGRAHASAGVASTAPSPPPLRRALFDVFLLPAAIRPR
eukprot:4501313-Pleurochrysis_carterae.AAC.5